MDVSLRDTVKDAPLWLTVCVSGAEVLALKMPAPRYSATMVWLPAGSCVVIDAMPLPFNVAVPSSVDPSTKRTVPVGVPEADDTVAVSVNGSPETVGFCDDASVVAVDASAVSTTSLPSPPAYVMRN